MYRWRATLERNIVLNNMKYRFLFVFAACLGMLTSCGNDNPDKGDSGPEPGKDAFVIGADISWASEMEHDGMIWRDADGNGADIMSLMFADKARGLRLRVWVDPAGGWSGSDDVVALAKRAVRANPDTRIMIDFHYSDFFADPGKQNIPSAWTDHSAEALTKKVGEHTKSVLQALKAQGVEPEWVQIGNETRNGMLWPTGKLWDESGDRENGWKNFVAMCNEGTRAAKEIFPDVKIVIHLNNAWEDNLWWYRKFLNAGGAIDMIGLSHYPMTENKGWKEINGLAISNMKILNSETGLPIIVSEVGVKPSDPEANECLSSFVRATKSVCGGVFYWEPEVFGGWKPGIYGSLGWGPYDMAAFADNGSFGNLFSSFWNE